MPKLSVIMPVYNSEKYVDEAIASIIAQTFTDFELIIVNDGSTDNTVALIEEWLAKDQRIILVSNKNKKGVAGALNTGLELSRGEYLARMDSDDISLPNRFAIQVDYLDVHQEVMIIGSHYEAFNSNGFRTIVRPPADPLQIAWSFTYNTHLCHPSVMFRRQVYSEFGGYPYEPAEDYALFSMVVRKYKARNLTQVLLRFRLHNGSVTFVNKSGIGQSQAEISPRNYRYYFNSMEYYQLFVDFQRGKVVRFSQYPLLAKMSLQLAARIRQQYHAGLLSAWPLFRLILGKFLVITVYKFASIFRIN